MDFSWHILVLSRSQKWEIIDDYIWIRTSVTNLDPLLTEI